MSDKTDAIGVKQKIVGGIVFPDAGVAILQTESGEILELEGNMEMSDKSDYTKLAELADNLDKLADVAADLGLRREGVASALPSPHDAAEGIRGLLSELEALRAERDGLRNKAPMVSTGGPCGCCGQPEGSRCTCYATQQSNAELTRRLEAMERLYRAERDRAFKPFHAHERQWETEYEEQHRIETNKQRKAVHDAATDAAIKAAGGGQ